MLRSFLRTLSCLTLGVAAWWALNGLASAQPPTQMRIPIPAQGNDPWPDLHDPVTELNRAIESGKVDLEYRDDGWGYLSDVLELLDVNTDTQALVFSRTSLQQSHINPQHPRAIYYNDNVEVGAVDQGEVFEFTSLDPEQGIVYYTLNQARADKPRFVRDLGLCAQCHSPMNPWGQGIAVASAFTQPDGRPFFLGRDLFDVTDHRTPFEERWGGWYVTGTHGNMKHRGNALAPSPYRPYELDLSSNTNITSLKGRFDVDHYLEPTSDLISLMTLEHQTQMTNLITGIAEQARRVVDVDIDDVRRPSRKQFEHGIEEVVAYMLFADEAKLEDPIAGVSTFTDTFPKRGPADSHGRSLRDFDLRTRLFKYPLSYMIYDPAFDTIPARAKDKIYQRIYEVLSGEDQSERYASLPMDRRQAALEILKATKSGLPDYYFE